MQSDQISPQHATNGPGVRSAANHTSTLPDLPERWRVGTNFTFPVPKPAKNPWEACRKLVEDYDDDMCRAWKDEIDKLLIFAGLFSATVTAFAAESYTWLDNPADTNTDLLAQLVRLQLNNSNPSSVDFDLGLIPPFKPSESAVRINVVWFLSLTLSLGTVLIGVLCLQWLRAFQRRTSGPLQDRLARRQMTFDGLIAWKVPEIISSLPLILELSLILFFVGMVDLLWMRHPTVAILVAIPIAAVILVVVFTTLMPAIELVLGEGSDRSPRCPYRSPQALLACNALTLICRGLRFVIPRIRFLYSDLRDRDLGMYWSWDSAGHKLTSYEAHLARTIQWIQRNFGFTTEILYNLYHCLTELDDDELARFATVSGFQLHGGAKASTDPEVLREFTYLMFLWDSVGLGTKSFDPFIDEHYIRVLNTDPSVPRPWAEQHNYQPPEIKVLEPSMQEEFINQRLHCALTLLKQNSTQRDALNIWKELRYPTKHLHRFSPQTDYLLRQVVSKIKRWLLKGRPNQIQIASYGAVGNGPATSSPPPNARGHPIAPASLNPNAGHGSPTRNQLFQPNTQIQDLRRSTDVAHATGPTQTHLPRPSVTIARPHPTNSGDMDLQKRVRSCAYGIQSLLSVINALPPCTLKAHYADLAWTIKDLSLLVTDKNHTGGRPEIAMEIMLVFKQANHGHGRGHNGGANGGAANAGPQFGIGLGGGVGESFYKEQEWAKLFANPAKHLLALMLENQRHRPDGERTNCAFLVSAAVVQHRVSNSPEVGVIPPLLNMGLDLPIIRYFDAYREQRSGSCYYETYWWHFKLQTSTRAEEEQNPTDLEPVLIKPDSGTVLAWNFYAALSDGFPRRRQIKPIKDAEGGCRCQIEFA
ncbi:hypothetical protein BDN72DRAFT_858511 [Pluteus cervinus]|uniref:Uncharacterized protein n=1 Tax=Pluteus cervinus TaxID=181527 RepID=A0ACD3ARE7_9AGAR|nr:hypothetical protein BDN72DRAFT_858511 [Pluteus cervinus]